MIADQSLNILNNKADTLIALSNENILYLIDRKTSLLDAFKSVDDILEHTISNITDIVNFSGLINLDLADLKTVLDDAGRALLGIGEAEGEGRSVRAVRAAIDSPFFSLSFKGSKGIVFIMAGGDNLSIHEVNEAAKQVIGAVDSDCRVVFGVATNPAMGNKVRITVIATGFSQNPTPHLESVSNVVPITVRDFNRPVNAEIEENNIRAVPIKTGETFKDGDKIPEPADELEIPSFLRKKKII
jgi:cell division protein FtsZ